MQTLENLVYFNTPCLLKGSKSICPSPLLCSTITIMVLLVIASASCYLKVAANYLVTVIGIFFSTHDYMVIEYCNCYMCTHLRGARKAIITAPKSLAH